MAVYVLTHLKLVMAWIVVTNMALFISDTHFNRHDIIILYEGKVAVPGPEERLLQHEDEYDWKVA